MFRLWRLYELTYTVLLWWQKTHPDLWPFFKILLSGVIAGKRKSLSIELFISQTGRKRIVVSS